VGGWGALCSVWQQYRSRPPYHRASRYCSPLLSLIIVPLVLLALSLEALASSVATPVWALANFALEQFMSLLEWLGDYGGWFLLDYDPSRYDLFALALAAFLILVPREVPWAIVSFTVAYSNRNSDGEGRI
ncbi:MAG: hypothetical protein ACI9OO_001804, partial [Bacteroidia bacterium]